MSTTRIRGLAPAAACCGWLVAVLLAPPGASAAKQTSTLYPAAVAQRVRSKVDKTDWGRACRDAIRQSAERWRNRSDDELWELMFGPGLTRSWMVWSNGYCPACRESVPMYNWQIDALAQPWKVRCPHCQERFPKNDFQAFYRSGLGRPPTAPADSAAARPAPDAAAAPQSVPPGPFDPSTADRSLLFHTDHPDHSDPLHQFGVDDGEGYVEQGKRWRFIGTYLVYGQWKQAVLGGIRELAAAHLLTGELVYAHQAAIMLDRVADVWPDFDFKTQAAIYEQRNRSDGYVSVWHDACEEARQLALSYDMIFDAIRQDPSLPDFLSRKARECGLENPKSSFADIQRNIEGRLLRDTLANRHKIHSNYPRQQITEAVILAVLGLDANRPAFDAIVGAMLEKATAVDGVTGEKGLANYTAFTIQTLSVFLGELSKSDPAFLPDALRRFPALARTYRFHIDTHCLGRYYPLSGDTGWFAAPMEHYLGMPFPKPGPGQGGWTGVPPSSHALLWRLYQLTGDPAYVQTMVRMNDGQTQNLPRDLYTVDSQTIGQAVQQLIAREGDQPRLESLDLRDWHLAILRSGTGAAARAVWLDYDSGGGHGHHDGMNLGLFAFGLDLMPDFGYPPVQFGGWGSPKARWYTCSAAHNTVVVDGENSLSAAGKTTFWGNGQRVHVVRAAGPALNHNRRFERTTVLVDVTPDDFYVVDVFRVAGGSDHTKFVHSHFGTVQTKGLALQPGADDDHGGQMRDFRWDRAPAPGWSVEWHIEDRYRLLPPGCQVRLRYTDLTTEAQAGLAEGWIVAGPYDSTDEAWIPRVLVRRQQIDDSPLESTFVALVDPYTAQPTTAVARRLAIQSAGGRPLPDTHVALSIALAGGGRDVLILTDPARRAGAESIVTGPAIHTDAELALVRFDPEGRVSYVALGAGSRLTCGQTAVAVADGAGLSEHFPVSDAPHPGQP